MKDTPFKTLYHQLSKKATIYIEIFITAHLDNLKWRDSKLWNSLWVEWLSHFWQLLRCVLIVEGNMKQKIIGQILSRKQRDEEITKYSSSSDICSLFDFQSWLELRECLEKVSKDTQNTQQTGLSTAQYTAMFYFIWHSLPFRKWDREFFVGPTILIFV